MISTIQRLKGYLLKHEKAVLLSLSFVSVFALGFLTAQVGSTSSAAPIIRIEKSPIHSSILKGDFQTEIVAGEADVTVDNCTGKIKGNISSASKIYHLPGGSFYNRTQAEMCFNTEAEAQAAGFRRSQR